MCIIGTVDAVANYTREVLIDGLTAILESWSPRIVRTLDSSTSPAESSDHPDHYYSALFTQEAIQRFSKLHSSVPEHWIYNAYTNRAERPNVGPTELLW